MKVKDNNKIFFEEIPEGDCFMWCEKFFIKMEKPIGWVDDEWINSVCIEDGHVFFFKNGEIVSRVNAELNIN